MHEFDPSALESYLAREIAGFTTLDRFEKYSEGQSNPTYRVSSGQNTFVLRAKPPGTLLKSAHAVDREYRVMKALSGTSVPVPQVFHLSGDDTPLGRQFVVMEHIDGRIFWDPALPDLTKEERAALYDGMNTTLAALHSVDPEVVGLCDFGRPGNYFARQVTRWSGQYQATATTHLPDADWLIDWLSERMVVDDGAVAIVHGDYRIDNMIFDPDRIEIRAVLDWELSTLGHPLADLAYQCMHWRLPHKGDFRGLGGLDRAALGLPTEEEYVASYCARRHIPQPENWSFYLVFSYFRLLAILQGVLKRAQSGNASNPRDQSMMSRTIAQMARDARALAQSEP